MTRKDYVLIADSFLNQCNSGITPCERQVLVNVALTMCFKFSLDNPKFDKGLFMCAAGLSS